MSKNLAKDLLRAVGVMVLIFAAVYFLPIIFASIIIGIFS